MKTLLFIKRWSIEIAIVALILIVGGLWLNARHEAKASEARAVAAEKARDEALKQAAQGEAAIAEAKALQQRVDILDGERQTLLAKVDTLKAELAKRPMPPKPGPAPSELAQVVVDLRAMGTQPELLAPLKLAFPPDDGPTLWTWGKEAARVPALEGRIVALEDFSTGVQLTLGKTAEQLKATEEQRDLSVRAADSFKAAYASSEQRGDILKVELGQTVKQRDRARRTRVYLGLGGLALGFYLGSR